MVRSAPFQLSVGRLVSVSIGIYVGNLIPFLFLGSLVLGPWIALQFWIAETDLDHVQAGLAALGAMILINLLTMLLTGAIVYGVAMQMRGDRPSLGDCVGKGLGAFAGVLGTSILCGFRIFVMALLLIVPGIIEMIRLYVAVPVAVIEGKVGNEAVRRSINLVRGSGWPLFWSWLLVSLIAGFLAAVGMFVAIIVNPQGFRGAEAMEPNPWIPVIISVPIHTFSATMIAVAYMQLRLGKENVDAAAIAKVFE